MESKTVGTVVLVGIVGILAFVVIRRVTSKGVPDVVGQFAAFTGRR